MGTKKISLGKQKEAQARKDKSWATDKSYLNLRNAFRIISITAFEPFH